jgi:hypothetical protein
MQYRFNSHPLDELQDLVADGRSISCAGMQIDPAHGLKVTEHAYAARDGVLLALERPGHSSDDMLWAYVASAERQGLFDLRVGEVVTVTFDEPFAEVFTVTLYQIPHRLARPDYGSYRVHWAVDALTERGFAFVSSYYEDSPQTEERAFLVGWRAFGLLPDDPVPPLWRLMLANAHRHLLEQRWYLALLEAAFALEAAIDSAAGEALTAAGVPDVLVEDILRRDELRVTLRATAEMRQYPAVSASSTRSLADELRKRVFTPRNRLAHGRVAASAVDEETARRAVACTQQVIWDWFPEARAWLVLVNRAQDLADLRDA